MFLLCYVGYWNRTKKYKRNQISKYVYKHWEGCVLHSIYIYFYFYLNITLEIMGHFVVVVMFYALYYLAKWKRVQYCIKCSYTFLQYILYCCLIFVGGHICIKFERGLFGWLLIFNNVLSSNHFHIILYVLF